MKWKVILATFLIIGGIIMVLNFSGIPNNIFKFSDEYGEGYGEDSINKISKTSVYKNAAQTLTTGVQADVTFELVAFDDLNQFDNTNDKIVIKERGWYIIVGQVGFVTGAGPRAAKILINGTDTAQSWSEAASAGINSYYHITHFAQLEEGDEVHMRAYQKSGGNLNIIPNAHLTYLNVYKTN